MGTQTRAGKFTIIWVAKSKRFNEFPTIQPSCRNQELPGRKSFWSRQAGPYGKRQLVMQGALEAEPETKFDLAGSAERIDPCSHTHAVDTVSYAGGTIDLARGSRKQSVQGIAR
jgi:hypothetical protein